MLYTALLQHLGCTAYSHESARVWGDDVVTTRVSFLSGSGDPKDIWRVLDTRNGEGDRPIEGQGAGDHRRDGQTDGCRRQRAATCEVARGASQGLGLPEPVQVGLSNMFAMWNGKGFPNTAGEAIPLASRVMQVALTAVMFASHANTEVAISEVRRRAGTQLDPSLADVLVERADELLGDLDELDAYQAVLDAEPEPCAGWRRTSWPT